MPLCVVQMREGLFSGCMQREAFPYMEDQSARPTPIKLFSESGQSPFFSGKVLITKLLPMETLWLEFAILKHVFFKKNLLGFKSIFKLLNIVIHHILNYFNALKNLSKLFGFLCWMKGREEVN